MNNKMKINNKNKKIISKAVKLKRINSKIILNKIMKNNKKMNKLVSNL